MRLSEFLVPINVRSPIPGVSHGRQAAVRTLNFEKDLILNSASPFIALSPISFSDTAFKVAPQKYAQDLADFANVLVEKKGDGSTIPIHKIEAPLPRKKLKKVKATVSHALQLLMNNKEDKTKVRLYKTAEKLQKLFDVDGDGCSTEELQVL